MAKFQEALDCPFKTEDSPEYLSQLSCGHFASTKEWHKYKEQHEANQRIPCPQCREPTNEIGHTLSMTVINQFIQDIKVECTALNELLERNQDAANIVAFSRSELTFNRAESCQDSTHSETSRSNYEVET